MSQPTTTPPRCPACGHQGPLHGKSFCEVCGEFNDWDALAAPELPPAGQGRPGPTHHNGAPLTDGDEQRRARELLVPLAEEPPPVYPAEPERRRPTVGPVTAADEHGVTCWRCGRGNNTQRRFCRNCGADLRQAPRTAAPALPPPPPPPVRAAPSPGNRTPLLVGLAVLAVICCLGVYLLYRSYGDDDTVVVTAAQVTATHYDPQHPPTSAFDGNPTSWWGTGNSGDDDGDTLTAGFAEPVDLTAMRIVPGTSDRAEDRGRQNRPERVDLAFADSSGRTTTISVKLTDTGPQVVTIAARDVTRVALTIRSAYVAAPDRQVAVAEVQFLARR